MQKLRGVSVKSYMEIISQSTVKLCPCNKSGCPTLEKDGDVIVITDDYGDSVKMSIDEAKEMAEALAYLESV